MDTNNPLAERQTITPNMVYTGRSNAQTRFGYAATLIGGDMPIDSRNSTALFERYKMCKFLQELKFWCNHKWVERSVHNVCNSPDKVPDKIVVVLRCEICGKLKNHKIQA